MVAVWPAGCSLDGFSPDLGPGALALWVNKIRNNAKTAIIPTAVNTLFMFSNTGKLALTE